MTWNINSVRLRLPLLLQLAEEVQPDVICLQETKCPDEAFPHKALAAAGFEHRHIYGMKGYNGVAILSKQPFTHAQKPQHVGLDDCRHAHVTLHQSGLHVHCLYIPAGGDIPDRTQNPKYGHKLDFVESLTKFFKPADNQILMGDFNIAPLEHDVWSHKQLLDVISHTEPEVTRLNAFLNGGQFIDVSRHFVPDTQKCYTWWSYRNKDWKASNRGRRLDHVWVSPNLHPKLKAHHILAHTRDWDRTSDHVPVVVELA